MVLVFVVMISGCLDEIMDDQYRYDAVDKKDASICDKIKDSWYKDICYGTVAQYKKDASICDKVQDPYTRDGCYKDVGILTRDPSICAKIQDNRGYQYHECYAVAKGNISICDELKYYPNLRRM